MPTCKYVLVNKLITETSALDLLAVVAGPTAVISVDGDSLGVEFDVLVTVAMATAVLSSSV